MLANGYCTKYQQTGFMKFIFFITFYCVCTSQWCKFHVEQQNHHEEISVTK